MRLRGAFVALGLVGCGSVSDNSNNIDAAVVPDTEAPKIVSSAPADKATKVSVLSPVSVFVDEALDPASVSAATVKLGYLQEVPRQSYFFTGSATLTSGPGAPFTTIPGTVAYDDASHKISFTPLAPLPWGYQLSLVLDGVKDTAGNELKQILKFQTYANGQRAIYSYSSGAPQASWTEFGVDPQGQMLYRVNRTGPGGDGVYFSMDDAYQNIGFVTRFTPEGRLIDDSGGAWGPDMKFGTMDDVPQALVHYSYNAEGQLTERYGTTNPGADAMWGTPDDIPAFTVPFEVMGIQVKSFVYVTNPGTDGVWRTVDDKCTSTYGWVEYEYNPAGLKARETYHSCGADQLPKNADDAIVSYKEYAYDPQGQVVRATGRTAIGADNMWGTPDDAFGGVDGVSPTRYDRDAKERVTVEQRISGPGTDGMWFTADDPGTVFRNKYLANGLLEETVTFTGSGSDGVWGTPDDPCTSYIKYTYDPNGNRISVKTYTTGTDTMPHTIDDQLVSQIDYDTAH